MTRFHSNYSKTVGCADEGSASFAIDALRALAHPTSLGRSATAKHYAIKSMEEARQYLNHPVLGKRLLECAEAVFTIEGRSISEIFGYPDNLKLKSSMTLFACVAAPHSVFSRVIDKYFNGERDALTLQLLEKLKPE